VGLNGWLIPRVYGKSGQQLTPEQNDFLGEKKTITKTRFCAFIIKRRFPRPAWL